MALVECHQFELFADYFQFHLQDEAILVDLSESWSQEAVDRFLAVATGIIGVGTARSMDVPVGVEIHDSEPPLELESWDHVNECSIELSSTRLVVAGSNEYLPDAARIEMAPGHYRVRVAYGGLRSLARDRLSGSDRYRVQVWSGSPCEVRVLKRLAA